MAQAGAASLRGGKRLRARFLLTGCRAVERGSGPVPPAIEAPAIGVAAALEVFQAAALVHAAPTPPAAATRRQYSLMRRDVTIGQFLDVAEESAFAVHDDGTHAERALRVASYKSARYSIQKPLQIGAALAGADATQLDALGRFGHDIGMAFQLRDDVLGVFGDAAVTGKPSGDDLREGKRTVLVAYARQALSADRRSALDAMLGDRTLDAERIRDLQRTIASLSADAVAELRALARAATQRTS